MNKKFLLALVPILIGILYQELGIKISSELAMSSIALLATVIGYFLKDTKLIEEAEQILLPSAEDVLGDVEKYLEKRYSVQIPDEWKRELLKLILGDVDGY